MRRFFLGPAPLLLCLAACQATSPVVERARPNAAGAPSGSTRPSTAPKASPAASAASAAPAVAGPKLGIPARVNLPIPTSLLGPSLSVLSPEGVALLANDGGSLIANDGAALIANDGGSLIANDGAGLIANDGAGLIANDGAGLIANDGAGVVAGGAGNYRLQQKDIRNHTQLLLSLSAAGVTPKLASSLNLMLYAWQVVSVNMMLRVLGTKRWVSGVPQALVVGVPFPDGNQQSVLANVVPLPGRPGPDGKPTPTFVGYEVREQVKRHVVGGQALPPRPDTPFVTLEVYGEGKGRVVWRQSINAELNASVAFATTFDLKAERILAEAALSEGSQELRHIRWAFDKVDGRLRVFGLGRIEGPSVPQAQVLRRLAIQMLPEGQAALSVQVAPLGGPFAWLVDRSGGLGPEATFFGLDAQGEVLDAAPSQGPRADDGLSMGLSFPGLGALSAQIPARAEQAADQQPGFAFPDGWEAPRWTVISSPEMEATLRGEGAATGTPKP